MQNAPKVAPEIADVVRPLVTVSLGFSRDVGLMEGSGVQGPGFFWTNRPGPGLRARDTAPQTRRMSKGMHPTSEDTGS